MNKIAVAGKGGVGKTTVAALLAKLYAEMEHSVIAVDADPAASLGFALGMPDDLLKQITPISEMDELIRERTGAEPGSYGTYFKLNPRVDDIPDTCSVQYQGVKLLRLGSISTGGTGCICPESAILKSLVTYLILHNKEVLIMDMEAGLEHLGRATAGAVDQFLVVVEPGRRSMETGLQIAKLAKDIGINNLSYVANKVRGDTDEKFIREYLPAESVIGILPFSERAIEADKDGVSIYDNVPELVTAVRSMVDNIQVK